MKSAQAILDLMSFFVQMVKNVLQAIEAFGSTYDARSLEAYVEAQGKAMALLIFESCWRIRMQDRPVPTSLPCACGQRQHHKGVRGRELRTVLGTMNLEARHYFYCDHCRRSSYHGDDLRGSVRSWPRTVSPLWARTALSRARPKRCNTWVC